MTRSSPDWTRILAHLTEGGVVAHPTETVYGLAAPATEDGVAVLRRIKPRGPDRPFLMLLPDPSPVWDWSREFRWTPEARRIAERHWPGPVTLILEPTRESWPEGVRSRSGGVAVRRTPHPLAAGLVERWGSPLLSTSANRPGRPAARSSAAVRRELSIEVASGLLLVVDGGSLPDREPSTLIDCTGDVPRILREGALPRESLIGPAARGARRA